MSVMGESFQRNGVLISVTGQTFARQAPANVCDAMSTHSDALLDREDSGLGHAPHLLPSKIPPRISYSDIVITTIRLNASSGFVGATWKRVGDYRRPACSLARS